MKRSSRDGAFLGALLLVSAVPFVIALTSPEGDAYAARTAGSSSASASGSYGYHPRPPTSGSGSSSFKPPPPPPPSGSASSHWKK